MRCTGPVVGLCYSYYTQQAGNNHKIRLAKIHGDTHAAGGDREGHFLLFLTEGG
jgi:hypothetical protein